MHTDSNAHQLDVTLDRTAFHSEKYALRAKLFGREDIMPLWVADMDLPTPPFIIEALQHRLTHPNLGYTLPDEAVFQAIIDWQARNHYAITKEQLVLTHNVANGFFMAVQAFTQPGDNILVQPPVYPPFIKAPTLNQRNTVLAPLQLIEQRYHIDFDALAQLIDTHKIKLFLFCHPQNPSGRVWQRHELEQLADICLQRGVTIVADEIHSDMVFAPQQHIPLASLNNAVAQHTITLNSPGKTFNLGGLQIGYAVIANPQLRAQYLAVCQSNGIDNLNLFALSAIKAAYSEAGENWLQASLALFSQHFDTLERFLQHNLPKVRFMRPEASYLVWLDFSAYFYDQQTLQNWLVQEAKLGLNNGESFAGNTSVGRGFMRMNLAISSTQMQQVITALHNAIPALPQYQTNAKPSLNQIALHE